MRAAPGVGARVREGLIVGAQRRERQAALAQMRAGRALEACMRVVPLHAPTRREPCSRLALRTGLLAGAILVLACGGCVHKTALVAAARPKPAPGQFLQGPRLDDPHVPRFANDGWAPFSRAAVVAIALREWRLFGQPVDDDPPNTRPLPLPEDKPERQEGLWQRVGEYWWIGQDADSPQVSWTGKHDAAGAIFPAGEDGNFAWSAAFISYVMRVAGAGARFPYAESHSTYINLAASGADAFLRADAPQLYAPALGDLICEGRGRAARLRFADLPTASPFPSHCDIVVGIKPGMLSVIGGNVDDAVTEKHIPVAANGMLAGPDGVVLDTRYAWFVVLQILYQPGQQEESASF